MTEAGKQIVDLFKKQKTFTLAGNREYWEELYFIDGKIVHAGGDTLANSEEFRDEISEEEALRKLKSHLSTRAWVFDKSKRLETDAEILEYWQSF